MVFRFDKGNENQTGFTLITANVTVCLLFTICSHYSSLRASNTICIQIAAYFPKFSLLCQAHCFSQLSIHRGKDLVHQDAALAALVAAGVPTLPEVDLAVAAKSTDEATVDLDLP